MRTAMVLVSMLVLACGGSDAPSAPAAPPPPPPPPTAVPAPPPSPAVPSGAPQAAAAEAGGCTLLSFPVLPHRAGGKAQVKLSGSVTAEGKEQPAVCGAYWVKDQKVMRKEVKAGQGTLFETCLPEGLIQIYSDDEGVGVRNLKAKDLNARTNALFNPKAGGSYLLMRGGKDDKLVIDDDRRGAKGVITLSNLAGGGEVRVEFEFDCP